MLFLLFLTQFCTLFLRGFIFHEAVFSKVICNTYIYIQVFWTGFLSHHAVVLIFVLIFLMVCNGKGVHVYLFSV